MLSLITIRTACLALFIGVLSRCARCALCGGVPAESPGTTGGARVCCSVTISPTATVSARRCLYGSIRALTGAAIVTVVGLWEHRELAKRAIVACRLLMHILPRDTLHARISHWRAEGPHWTVQANGLCRGTLISSDGAIVTTGLADGRLVLARGALRAGGRPGFRVLARSTVHSAGHRGTRSCFVLAWNATIA